MSRFTIVDLSVFIFITACCLEAISTFESEISWILMDLLFLFATT